MVEIIPKPAVKFPLWQNILLYFSLVLFLVSLLSLFTLDRLQKKAVSDLQDLKQALTRERTSQEKILEKEVLLYQEKINNFSDLINLHKNPLNSFSLLENLCHPKVQWISFNLNPQELKIVLSGQAEDFQALGQQIFIFKKEPLIKEVTLFDLSLGKEEGAEFGLNLSLSPEIFK